MKINYLETELSPIGFLARDSLSGVAELVKGLITRNHVTGGEAELLAARLLAEQGERLFLPWRGSAPYQLEVAQENLVSGTAESSSWRCRAYGRAAE